MSRNSDMDVNRRISVNVANVLYVLCLVSNSTIARRILLPHIWNGKVKDTRFPFFAADDKVTEFSQ